MLHYLKYAQSAYHGKPNKHNGTKNSTNHARAELLKDLQQTQPKYIVDELGFFNSALEMDNYPELKDFLSNYKLLGNVERFFIYRRRVPKEKNKNQSSIDK